MNSIASHLIFVYGTLMQGHGNHGIIAREQHQFIGKGRTVHPFHMRNYGSAFPVVIKEGNPRAQVVGEIFSINDDTLKMLDRLESNGHMYQREFVDISHPTRGYYQCEMYFGIPQHWKGTIEHLKVPELCNGAFAWR